MEHRVRRRRLCVVTTGALPVIRSLAAAVVRMVAVAAFEPILPLVLAQMNKARCIIRKELLELENG